MLGCLFTNYHIPNEGANIIVMSRRINTLVCLLYHLEKNICIQKDSGISTEINDDLFCNRGVKTKQGCSENTIAFTQGKVVYDKRKGNCRICGEEVPYGHDCKSKFKIGKAS